MTERIIVKNFGPINDIEIDIRNINIFIGTTSSGKSTVAKLIAIFQTDGIRNHLNSENKKGQKQNDSLKKFHKMLLAYNIHFPFDGSTVIRYERGGLYFEIRNTFMESTFSPYNALPLMNPVYIPAERVFYSTLSQSIFSLINNDVSLPKWLLDFGNKFEKARRDLSSLEIQFLNTTYSFNDGNDMLALTNGQTIRLSQASSGLQSIIPLMIVLQALTEDQNNIEKEFGNDFFIIEEPEMNLFPSSQKSLLEFIIERVKRCADKVVITTHSPYILTSLDNLVQAENVSREPDMETSVEQLVPKELWTNFDDVSCYFFDNGEAQNTLDPELRSLGPSKIDNVSDDLGKTFEALLNLKYSTE